MLAVTHDVEVGGRVRPRVLFVSHEATRTGAPMMFLHFLRWVQANTDLDMEILLLAGGPLTGEFERTAPTTLIEARGGGGLNYLEAGIMRAGFPRTGDRLKVARGRRAARDLKGFDAVYLNSSTAALALRILPEIPPVVLSHIHEMGGAFTHCFDEDRRADMLRTTNRFITCAEVVSRHLVEAWDVQPDRVACHYEFVSPPLPDARRAAKLRRSLGIPEEAPVVGSSGLVIWRKAPDLFLQAAATIERARPDLGAHYVWVGGEVDDDPMPIHHDLQRLGMSDRVHFVGEVDDTSDLFSLLDAFCLTSREDPYPLVMLEAAALGVPIVAFDNGGVREFAGDDRRALVVDYLDVEALADAVIQLLDDDVTRKDIGRRGQERVLREHTVDVAAAHLYEELIDTIHHPDGRAISALQVPSTVPGAAAEEQPCTLS